MWLAWVHQSTKMTEKIIGKFFENVKSKFKICLFLCFLSHFTLTQCERLFYFRDSIKCKINKLSKFLASGIHFTVNSMPNTEYTVRLKRHRFACSFVHFGILSLQGVYIYEWEVFMMVFFFFCAKVFTKAQ